MTYARRIVNNAVASLAIGAGPIRDRLQAACAELLALHSEDIPEGLRLEFSEFTQEMKSSPAKKHEGNIAATIETMNIAAMQAKAKALLDLRDRLEDMEG